jgi:hypothetical protein
MQSALEAPNNRHALARAGGMPLIASLLRALPAPCLTHAVFVAVVELATALDHAADTGLACSTWRAILCDLSLWQPAALPEQEHVVRRLLQIADSGLPSMALQLRSAMPVPAVIDAIREFYRPASFPDSAADDQSLALADRQHRAAIGHSLLQLAGSLVRGSLVAPDSAGLGSALDRDAYTALAVALLQARNVALQEDLLQVLNRIVHERPGVPCQVTSRWAGPSLFLPLLKSKSANVRCLALTLVSLFLRDSTTLGAGKMSAMWAAACAHIEGVWQLDEEVSVLGASNVAQAIMHIAGAPLSYAEGQPPGVVLRLNAALLPAILRLVAKCEDLAIALKVLAALDASFVQAAENQDAVLAAPQWPLTVLELLAEASEELRPAVLSILGSLLGRSVASSPNGGADFALVLWRVQSLHDAGSIDGSAVVIELLCSTISAVLAKESAASISWGSLAGRGPTAGGRGGSGSGTCAGDWAVVSDWDTRLKHHLPENVGAVGSVLEELYGGQLFGGGAVAPGPAGLEWSKRHWTGAELVSMGATNPDEQRGNLPPEVWRVLGLLDAQDTSTPAAPRRLLQLPATAWENLLPLLWRFMPVLLCACAAKPEFQGSGGRSPEAMESPGDAAAADRAASAQMLQAACIVQPLRICALVLIRALWQRPERVDAAYTSGGTALRGAVDTLGQTAWNHLHLLILTLNCARVDVLRARKQSAKAASTAVDRLILRFQQDVGWSLRDAGHARAMATATDPVDSLLSHIMPERVRAAASADVAWREHTIGCRAKIIAGLAARVSDTAIARAAEVASHSGDVEACAAAMADSDAARRAAASSARTQESGEAARIVRRCVRDLTLEREVWAPEDPTRSGRHRKLANIEDASHRRLFLKPHRSHLPYSETSAGEGGGSSGRVADAAAARKATLQLLRQAGGIGRGGGSDMEEPEENLDSGDPSASGAAVSGEAGESGGSVAASAPETAASASLAAMVPGVRTGVPVFTVEGCSLVTARGVVAGRVKVTDKALHFVTSDGSKCRSWYVLPSLVAFTHAC